MSLSWLCYMMDYINLNSIIYSNIQEKDAVSNILCLTVKNALYFFRISIETSLFWQSYQYNGSNAKVIICITYRDNFYFKNKQPPETRIKLKQT